MRTLITGSAGFVGTGLIQHLLADPAQHVVAAFTTSPPRQLGSALAIQVSELGADTDWSKALDRVDTVVHLASRVHVMNDAAVDPLAEFRRVNVAGSLHLARQAAAAGVRRFVYSVRSRSMERPLQPAKPFVPTIHLNQPILTASASTRPSLP